MKVCFETFGCRLSRAEALEDEAAFIAAGWETTTSHSEADVFVVRGCSVTARAQRDCERLIRHLTSKYPNTRLFVRGCLAVKNEPPRNSVFASLFKATANDSVSTSTARAYLKVQDGCAGKCSFCIVPRFRGSSISIGYDDVLDKAKRFIDAGYHEIVVTGCNLSLYASAGKRLPELIDALSDLGDCRIRLGSLEPSPCAEDTVQVVAAKPNCCHFLHIPVQSGSNNILALMRRPYSVGDVERLVSSAYSLMPDAGLGCDIITGFPGENDVEFLSTKGLIKRLPFNNAHIFPYSERPDTPAANFGCKIKTDLRSARAHVLSDIMAVKRAQFAHRFVGKEVEVVVENERDTSGWSSQYLWFSTLATPNRLSSDVAARKSRVTVKVTETHHDELRGEIV